MATCQKTICFAFPPSDSVAEATTVNLTQITLYIPESSPTFKSVFATVGFRQNETSADTITEHRVGIQLGAAGYSTFTETDDLTQSGEHLGGMIGPIDYTSYFSSNWSGTSMTCDCQVYFDTTTGTANYANVSVMLYITYEYDDAPGTNATQIKTVAIPFESITGNLPSTSTAYCTIPRLTSGTGFILPEASITVRDWFMTWEYSEAPNANTTDYVVTINRGGSDAQTYTFEQAQATSTTSRSIFKPSSVPDTTAEHTINAWVSTGSVARWVSPVVILWVTYEFNASTSTKLLNSRWIAWQGSPTITGTTDTTVQAWERDVLIPEPGTITLRASAFLVSSTQGGNGVDMAVKAGAQASFRTSATSSNSGITGPVYFAHRIDSGSASGSALTWAGGFNTISLKYYQTNTSLTANAVAPSGWLLLNYESDMPTVSAANAPGRASHTVFWLMKAWDADVTGDSNYATLTMAPTTPHTNYYLHSAGLALNLWRNAVSPFAGNFFDVNVALAANEGLGAGYWRTVGTGSIQAATTAETGGGWTVQPLDAHIELTPRDPDTDRFSLFTSRTVQLSWMRSSTTASLAWGAWLTIDFSALTFTASGTISGYTGDGSAIDVNIYSKAWGRKIDTVTTAAGGGYTAKWYDGTAGDLWSETRQDATHVGRSDDGAAVRD
jgi:hypothetical protein